MSLRSEYRRETREVVIPIAEAKRLAVLIPLLVGLIAFGGKMWAANAKLDGKADLQYVRTVDDSLGRMIVYMAGRMDRAEVTAGEINAILRLVCELASPTDRRKTGVRCP